MAKASRSARKNRKTTRKRTKKITGLFKKNKKKNAGKPPGLAPNLILSPVRMGATGPYRRWIAPDEKKAIDAEKQGKAMDEIMDEQKKKAESDSLNTIGGIKSKMLNVDKRFEKIKEQTDQLTTQMNQMTPQTSPEQQKTTDKMVKLEKAKKKAEAPAELQPQIKTADSINENSYKIKFNQATTETLKQIDEETSALVKEQKEKERKEKVKEQDKAKITKERKAKIEKAQKNFADVKKATDNIQKQYSHVTKKSDFSDLHMDVLEGKKTPDEAKEIMNNHMKKLEFVKKHIKPTKQKGALDIKPVEKELAPLDEYKYDSSDKKKARNGSLETDIIMSNTVMRVGAEGPRANKNKVMRESVDVSAKEHDKHKNKALQAKQQYSGIKKAYDKEKDTTKKESLKDELKKIETEFKDAKTGMDKQKKIHNDNKNNIKLIENGEGYKVHSMYAHGDSQKEQNDATIEHEGGHWFHNFFDGDMENNFGVSANKDAAAAYSGDDTYKKTEQGFIDKFAQTERGKTNWRECTAENFALYTNGHADKLHPDMQKFIKYRTTFHTDKEWQDKTRKNSGNEYYDKEFGEKQTPPKQPKPKGPDPRKEIQGLKIEDKARYQGANKGSGMGPNDEMVVANIKGEDVGFLWATKEEGGGFSVRKVETDKNMKAKIGKKPKGIAEAMLRQAIDDYGEFKGATDYTPQGEGFFNRMKEKGVIGDLHKDTPSLGEHGPISPADYAKLYPKYKKKQKEGQWNEGVHY